MKDITLFLIYIRDWIPKDSLPYLKESLEKISEEQKQKLLLLKFKNPLYGLLFSIIIPGVDRIYKGDIVLGVLKLILFPFAYISLRIAIDNKDTMKSIIFSILFSALLVWTILDIFLVHKGIAEDNLKKIFEIFAIK